MIERDLRQVTLGVTDRRRRAVESRLTAVRKEGPDDDREPEAQVDQHQDGEVTP